MRVKICGIRRYEDARCALDAGAWALGFVFHPPSPRSILPEEARAIVAKLPRDTLTVGVFVDRPLADVNRTIEVVGLRGAQLHGNEDLSYARDVRAEMVIKALRVGPAFRPRQALLYPGCRILLDAYQAGAPGGTGKALDRDVARQAAELVPIILAGGLNAENVEEAVERVRPHALDVSSGVEIAPGVKDPDKIRRLFEVVAGIEERAP